MMIDGFGRRIDYVRLSVTDRCNLRCVYCMPQHMTFVPRADLLTIDELAELGRILVDRGARRIRLTGGEPLVRPGVTALAKSLSALPALDELTVTTNGTRLAQFAEPLAAAKVRRINVSLDSVDPERFSAITRGGDLAQVLAGIDAARTAGIQIKVNMVAMADGGVAEVARMLAFCGERGLDLALIEPMPMGDIDEDRSAQYLPLATVRRALEASYTLIPTVYRTGGPARYLDVVETGTRLGLITPLSDNFCSACNRIRIAATGTVYGCLGHDQRVELRDLIRSGGRPAIDAALDQLLAGKPQRHEFRADATAPAVARHMSVTGG